MGKKPFELIMDEVRNEGIAIGKSEGIAIGEAKGLAKGEAKGFIKAFVSLVKDGLLSISEAAKRANMTEAEFTAILHAQNQ